MGKSAEAAAETRKNIVSTASHEFRQSGFDNVGLADLMSHLGLTHGGFYRHFASKDQLIAEACQESFSRIPNRWPKNGVPHTFETLTHIVTRYLSPKERDNPQDSCVFSCLSNDLARANDDIRGVATDGFREFADLLEKALPKYENKEQAEQEAASVICSMIGVLMMSRLVTDKKLSANLLANGRDQLLKSYEDKYPKTKPTKAKK